MSRLDTSLKTTLAAGGGYSNVIYFDSPGTWTSPATISSSMIKGNSGTGGGSGLSQAGASAGAGGTAGAGGNGTNSVLNTNFTGTPGGASVPVATGDISNPAAPNGTIPLKANNEIYIRTNYLHFASLPTGTQYQGLSITPGGKGGIRTVNPAQIGGTGGAVIEKVQSVNMVASTVYPVSIGQAGAGGGGGYNAHPAFTPANGGAGGGPNGGAAGLPGVAGGNGGLVPLSFLVLKGNDGAISGGTPAPTSAGGGGGGGTGMHGYLFLYWN